MTSNPTVSATKGTSRIHSSSNSEFNGQGEYGGLSQEEEVDLAAELLTVTNEDELDQFLGKFFRRVGRGVRGVMRNPVFRQLGGMVKGLAKQALPMAGAALGSIVPGVGTAIGGSLGTAASRLFEVDVETMSDEDAQFEVARRWVRLAGDAAQQARRVADARDPRQAAKQALATAARRHAPGLARALGSRSGMGRGGYSGATVDRALDPARQTHRRVRSLRPWRSSLTIGFSRRRRGRC